MSGLPGAEEARYGRPVSCHSCGYTMDAAAEAMGTGETGPTTPHGPEVPVGSLLLCLACGAFGEVDPDGDMAPIPKDQFEALLAGEDGRALVGALLARTGMMSSPQGKQLQPFRKIGTWLSRDTPPPPDASGKPILIDDAPGGPVLGNLWAWVSIDANEGEGIVAASVLPGQMSALVTGKERLARGGFRQTITAMVRAQTNRRFELRRYTRAETVEELGS